jgi:DHA2 family multidrug resistance protein
MLAPGNPAGASLLDQMINTQAQIIAYIDDYKFLLLTTIPAVACLFLMRKPKQLSASAPVHAVME